jgi:hypothetical protein
MSVPKIRGIAEAIEEIRREDPHSSVSQTYLRQLVKAGYLTPIYPGIGRRRVLINMAELYAFLENPMPLPGGRPQGIQPVPLKTHAGSVSWRR